MKRIVSLSNKFNGGKAVSNEKIARVAKMADGGIAGLLLCNGENGTVIRITISSTAEVDKTICLFPGALTSVQQLASIAGVRVDMIAAHGGDSNQKIDINCPNIAFYQKEMAHTPTRIKSIMVDADNARQLSYPLEFAAFGLINQRGQEPLFLTNYKDPKNNNDKMVVVNDLAWLQLDRYKAMYVTIGAGRSVTIELTVGERFNPASILEFFADFTGNE